MPLQCIGANHCLNSMCSKTNRYPIRGFYLAKRLKEREVGRGRANDDRVGVIPSFHEAPRVAVVRLSGAGNLVGKLVASEAGVVLLRDSGRTRVQSAKKHTCKTSVRLTTTIDATHEQVSGNFGAGKPLTQSTAVQYFGLEDQLQLQL